MTDAALPVTEKQLDLLRALRRWSLDHQRMPSVRELATALDRSPSTIQQHLGALERRDCLRRDGSAHGLVLLVDDADLGLDEDARGGALPLKGWLRPGDGIRRAEPPYERISLGGEWEPTDFLLQVEGDELAAEGILHGDLLAIRRGPIGDAPALLIFPGGMATVKRVLRRPGGALALMPATPRLDRRRARRTNGDFTAHGRLIRVIRRF